MSVNPTEEAVTARFLFTGVMLACFNREGEYEVGIIQCPEHEVEITITDLETGESKPLPWPKGHDLIFKVMGSETEGVHPYPPNGDDFDFAHVIDLEGPVFHREKVYVDTDTLQGKRLLITAGKLYTHALTPQEFELITWTTTDDLGEPVERKLGKIAKIVGLNVMCIGEKSGISILDSVTGEELRFLANEQKKSYLISIDNDCFPEDGPPLPSPITGTDFRFYYNVVTAPDGAKFDLQEVILLGGQGPAPSPGACVKARLSKTDTLGLSVPQP